MYIYFFFNNLGCQRQFRDGNDDDDDSSLLSRSIQLHLFCNSSRYYLTALVLANAVFRGRVGGREDCELSL